MAFVVMIGVMVAGGWLLVTGRNAAVRLLGVVLLAAPLILIVTRPIDG